MSSTIRHSLRARRLTTALAVAVAAALAAACGGERSVGPRLACAALGPAPGSGTGIAPGAGSLTMGGGAARYGHSAAFEAASSSALTVLDVHLDDAAGRPTAELFLFLHAAATPGQSPLVPVTLAQLHDSTFVPAGSFAVYADRFDAAAGDYTRWFVADSGCIALDAVQPGAVGLATGAAAMIGTWQSAQGVADSTGRLDATFAAPLVRLVGSGGSLADSARLTLAGARTGSPAAQAIDAFEVLAPDQTRFEVAATIPGDSTLELWLSLPGVPHPGDSIPIDSISLDQATSLRADVPFALLRVTRLQGASAPPAILQRWRSTLPAGWVRIDDAILPGPLALCGWVSGRFDFTAAGTDSASPPAALGALDASGRFATRVTVVPASDTLVTQLGLAPGPTLTPGHSVSCPF